MERRRDAAEKERIYNPGAYRFEITQVVGKKEKTKDTWKSERLSDEIHSGDTALTKRQEREFRGKKVSAGKERQRVGACTLQHSRTVAPLSEAEKPPYTRETKPIPQEAGERNCATRTPS